MIRTLTAAILLATSVAACITTDQLDQRAIGAEERAHAHVFCKSRGVNPGSDAYWFCRRRIDESGSVDEAVWQRMIGDKRALEKGAREEIAKVQMSQ
jgi:hypothetical protein